MNDPTVDNGIPLLTEIVAPTAAEPTRPAAAVQAPIAPPAALSAPARAPAQVTAATPAIVAATQSIPAAKPAASPLAAAGSAQSATAEPHALPPLTEEEWGRLESALHQRIARQVLERIDFVLDHRVRHTLTDVVDRAVDSLAAEVKLGLHDTLNEIVSRAVAQEINRLQASKK